MAERDGDSERGERDTGIEGGPAFPTVTDGGVPALDEFVRVLSERRRRCLLYCLWEDDVRDVDDLAGRVATRLDRLSPDEAAESRREAVEISLVHVDLPMLEDVGIISYDRRTRTLSLDHPPMPIETLVDACETLDECAHVDERRESGESTDASSRDR
ncbi:DUF7344 domain-containing protein [Natrinema salifodinae]|uniref:DUF7344 domain-containing protein n=1 Tax=Natrinema salifodinae TaxID=1202768 RepID=A0A1I0PIQ1_9EURY|nr:hypothetical protein [Natrinema salifodinae]SEW14257.1 hypothetical protein SAMN05216285_2611 [Natrinema salifodinae]